MAMAALAATGCVCAEPAPAYAALWWSLEDGGCVPGMATCRVTFFVEQVRVCTGSGQPVVEMDFGDGAVQRVEAELFEVLEQLDACRSVAEVQHMYDL